MITLKNINLSSIDLSGIDLRGIKLGLGGRGGGSGDGFPQLPGDVTRWHFGGLTNEMMAAMDDPRLEDADHKGRFLSFKNFAWDGMSGCDGYTESFLGDKINWKSEIHNSRKMSVFEGDRSKVSVIHNQYHFQTYVKISGINDNEGKVRGVYFYNMESNFTEGTICRTDGIYKIDITESNKRGVVGIWAYPAKKNEDVYDYPVTIEILPLYPGFILGDGVDDFAVTEQQLNFEDTYTVYTAFVPFQNDPARNMILCGKNDTKDFSINYSGTHLNFKPSTGVNLVAHINQFALLVCKRNKDITTIIDLSTGESNSLKSVEFIANPGLYYLWRNVFATFHAKAAIAGQTICNGYFSTDEDDGKVKDWYKKQYPWLFPDQAWTVTGKTNEDGDRATIANITGNGNDLVLSNFGFAEGSGYNEEGEYAGYLVTDGVDDMIRSSSFLFGNDFTVVGEWEFLQEDSNVLAGFNKNYTYFVLYNYISGVNVYVKNSKGTSIRNTKTLKAVTSEGLIYTDFNSEQKVEIADKVEADFPLYIAYNGNNYTKMAFKNLAIYPTILSKEDCIKAYNYLQTLKAK